MAESFDLMSNEDDDGLSKDKLEFIKQVIDVKQSTYLGDYDHIIVPTDNDNESQQDFLSRLIDIDAINLILYQ